VSATLGGVVRGHAPGRSAAAISPGELLTHATLLRRAWGPGYETQTEYTRVYVGRLRAKLERAGDQPLFITEPRSGYRFAAAS
jgi:two-component system, OmpR family, KDP operon response regulator KdpE